MSRIPLRLRLALAFALAMAVVLALVGSLLYVRLDDSLTEQVQDSLEARFAELSPRVQSGETDLPQGRLDPEESFFQVFDLVGTVLGGTPEVGTDALLPESDALGRLETGRLEYEIAVAEPIEDARVLAAPVETVDGPRVLLVGVSVEDREEALEGLLAQLLVVGPLALVLTSVGGYFLAGAALRPVEAMRGEAAEISSEDPGRRLPLPQANDEIRRLGETLNDMLARLEAGIARERRFVADASHELRTPLAALRTELELALRRPREPRELEDALRSATAEVERVVRLAEDLLVLARADDGRLPLDTSNHVVRELLDAVAGRYDARARAAGRAIEVAAPDDWICTGDRLRLEQALGNLVDNALRHGAGTIKLEAALADDLVELRISDEGTGFPPEFLPHAFERFSRADVARAEGGSGLGLAIVDAVARAHGGSATAANLPSGGAAITLSIPGARLAEPHLALI